MKYNILYLKPFILHNNYRKESLNVGDNKINKLIQKRLKKEDPFGSYL